MAMPSEPAFISCSACSKHSEDWQSGEDVNAVAVGPMPWTITSPESRDAPAQRGVFVRSRLTWPILGPGDLLAIVMQKRPGLRRDFLPSQNIVADQIYHFCPWRLELRRSQRPAGDSANMLLELRRQCPVHGPVAGVVNARGHLVDVEAIAAIFGDDEKFDGEDTDVIEALGDFLRSRDGFSRHVGRQPGRRDGAVQNMIAMLVFSHVESFESTIARTRCDDRNFSAEIDEAFEDRGSIAHRRPRGLGVAALQ